MHPLRHSLILLFSLLLTRPCRGTHPHFGGRHHNPSPRQEMANTLSVAIQTISTQSNPNPVTTPVGTVLASASLGAASALLGNLSRTSTNILGAMFPVSVVHIPVATICPAHTSISVSTLNNTSATPNSYNTTNQAFNATTRPPLLANTTSPTPTARLDDPNARIVLGDNGCQTLFSSTATAVCNTMISVGGQLPISVTDCGQWVTFSSSPICGPTPTGRGDATAYFLAPWLDIAGGAIPAEVQVRTCNGSSGCITGSESWTVDTKTASSTVVQVASFVGGAVGVSFSRQPSSRGTVTF